MAVNQIFDLGQRDVRALSRASFDIILAVARMRQAACPTAQLFAGDAMPQPDNDDAVMRRALLCGNPVETHRAIAPAARFFESGESLSPENAPDPKVTTEMNAAFTRAFQPMLKPSDLETAHRDDGANRAGSVME